MARRSYKNKTRKLQPAVMRLNFVASGNTTSYISISNAVSRLNRRFYRQGINWAVANVRVTSQPATNPTNGSEVYVSSLPHTWSVANAWIKSFSLWKKQQDDALDRTDSRDMAARYRDFKILMEETQQPDEAGLLDPVNVGAGRIAGPYAVGLKSTDVVLDSEEWLSSQIVIPNDGAPGVTNEYLLHMLGPDTGNSKGMIQGYAESRNLPVNPDPTSLPGGVEESWMQEMFNVGDDSDEATDNAQFRNNQMPYDQGDYPGGASNFNQVECQGYSWNMSTVGLNTMNTGPFTAPCGLLRIDLYGQQTEGSLPPKNFITVELVPGNNRGYLCETMEEF